MSVIERSRGGVASIRKDLQRINVGDEGNASASGARAGCEWIREYSVKE